METVEKTPTPTSALPKRVLLLGAVALVLLGLIGRKVLDPDVAYGESDSPSDGVHLVPMEKGNDKLVIYDAKAHQLFTFTALNGTDLRLTGWRDTSKDSLIWDTSLVKNNFPGVEAAGGTSMKDMMRNPNGTPGLIEKQKEQRKTYQVHLEDDVK